MNLSANLVVSVPGYFLQSGLWISLQAGLVLLLALLALWLFIRINKTKRQLDHITQEFKQCKNNEDFFRQVFANVPDGILIHDSEFRVIYANPAGEWLVGYSNSELKSLTILDLLPVEHQLNLKSVESNLFSGEKASFCLDARYIKKDKTEALVQLTITPIKVEGEKLYFQCNAKDVSEQKHMEENLRYYLKQVTRAQEEERKRIALELHDETVQYLIVLWRQLEALSLRSKELSQESIALIQELREQTKNVIQSVRTLSQDLRPATLDHLGLMPALEHLVSEAAAHSGITTAVHITGKDRRLPEEIEIMLFRISQEAMRNAIRHSHASKAEINVDFSTRKVKVVIQDNGRGFYLPSKISDLSQKGKLGLVGMQERARLIDGHLSITSEPEKGTMVIVEVPVPPA